MSCLMLGARLGLLTFAINRQYGIDIGPAIDVVWRTWITVTRLVGGPWCP